MKNMNGTIDPPRGWVEQSRLVDVVEVRWADLESGCQGRVSCMLVNTTACVLPPRWTVCRAAMCGASLNALEVSLYACTRGWKGCDLCLAPWHAVLYPRWFLADMWAIQVPMHQPIGSLAWVSVSRSFRVARREQHALPATLGFFVYATRRWVYYLHRCVSSSQMCVVQWLNAERRLQ